MAVFPKIAIDLSQVNEGLVLEIFERQVGTLFDQEIDSSLNNEARYQLLEGCFYDYELNDPNYYLGLDYGNIIQSHKKSIHLGTIAPNIYVGTLKIPIIEKNNKIQVHILELEVRSRKSNYRDDYRDMLEFITERTTDLLLQINSPIFQKFEPDYSKNTSPEVLYQRFVFIKSIIGSSDFKEAVHRVVTNPVTTWREEEEPTDIRKIKRFSRASIQELVKGNNRTALPINHLLRQYGLESVPVKIRSARKTDSVDTPENRFIKHALETFLKLSVEINARAQKLKEGNQLEKESFQLIQELESYLQHSLFSEISRPTTLKLNSPVLQRKEGYREVLRVWLMFDLAAKLIWEGGEDIYDGGKKDIATLYEYWLFFKLLELLQSLLAIEPEDIHNLIVLTDNGLNLKLKQGKFTPLKGVYNSSSRKFNVQFNYNRSFRGKNDYPSSGSWTTTLRPDYTLSIWPFGIDEHQAEKEELIVHIHFDAKYKVDNIIEFTDQDIEADLNEEKTANRKGNYKNADLLKMHAYKDAIRRSAGAYVLYPGTEKISRAGFHEIIPGLGAFPVRPSKSEDGTEELKKFILEVINHFIDRATQREKIALKSFQVYQNRPVKEDRVDDLLPEPFGDNRHLIPDETYVLIGYYKSEEHLNWIEKEKKYNFRTGTGNGSLNLDLETVSAKYLLLHTKGDKSSSRLWKIVSQGPKVFTKNDLDGKKVKYPDPKHDYYLVIELAPISEQEFLNQNWNFRKLKNYSKGNASAFPFTASLAELVKTRK